MGDGSIKVLNNELVEVADIQNRMPTENRKK